MVGRPPRNVVGIHAEWERLAIIERSVCHPETWVAKVKMPSWAEVSAGTGVPTAGPIGVVQQYLVHLARGVCETDQVRFRRRDSSTYICEIAYYKG